LPFFTYKNKMLCHMAAFKAHFAVGFWHGDDVVQKGSEDEAMGQLGRITSAADMPPRKEQAAMLKRAMALIDEGVKPGWAQSRALSANTPIGFWRPSDPRPVPRGWSRLCNCSRMASAGTGNTKVAERVQTGIHGPLGCMNR